MRRVLIRSAGGYDKLEIVEEPDPSPKNGEELVRVEAIGINYADVIVTEFPFDKVADAQRAIESGETTGKLVLVV